MSKNSSKLIKIKCANKDSQLTTKGIGDIVIKTENGTKPCFD